MGHSRASGYCSQGEGLHSGRDPNDSQGGTGKAEDAKTLGAGIIPKLCPRKCVVEMEHGSNRPIGFRGRAELGDAAYRTIGREVGLEGKMAVQRDRCLIRAFSAESRPQGDPLLSELRSAGQWARVRPGRAW
jgi:hypothetical protein